MILIIHTSLLYIVPGICYANLDKKYIVWHFFRKTTFQRHGWAHRKKKRCYLSSIYDLKVVNMRSAHQMCTNLTHLLILPLSQTWWTICKLQIKQKKYVHTAMCLLLLSTLIHTTMCLLHLWPEFHLIHSRLITYISYTNDYLKYIKNKNSLSSWWILSSQNMAYSVAKKGKQHTGHQNLYYYKSLARWNE